jgi:hypothetical protein
MSSPTTSPNAIKPTKDLYRLNVTLYDRMSSLLVALLIILGTMVTIMAIIYLTSQIFVSEKQSEFVFEQEGDQEEDPIGPGNDIEPPPPSETDIEEEQLDEMIEAVADMNAVKKGLLHRAVSGEGTGEGGGGTGRGRKGVRRNRVLVFPEGETRESYAQKLDALGIELAVLRPNNKALLISNVSQPSPKTRLVDRSAVKNRLRFTWTASNSGLAAVDRSILRQFGIDPGRHGIHKIVTVEDTIKLLKMEKEKAESVGRKPSKTIFGILPDGSGFKFYIVKQMYRSK